MKILGIETSCDETAVCIVEAEGGIQKPTFDVLGNALYSQIKIHAEYGGVFPMIAKREHAKNLVPLFKKALEDAGLYKELPQNIPQDVLEKLKLILSREYDLYETLIKVVNSIKKPDIDLISVTSGPGLEPALWVGIVFAQALSEVWNIPVIGANHMEGHIISPLITAGSEVVFPALALLISGGHTELVLAKGWMQYEVIGKTRDDAVGEAFDKVARLLSMPYPGGPLVSKLAHDARTAHTTPQFKLPRPMIKTDDFDFSFSGIKTAVLYTIQKIPKLTEDQKKEMALEFENAVTEVLVAKTRKALEEYEIKTLIIGGGVIANTYIREEFTKLISEFTETKLLIPETTMATDNAVMIAAAGYINHLGGKVAAKDIIAEGNLAL
ncbi:MAG: tRNA (adenosine(37)-N6)-threonylcarbamoyltransferase complex transferase subunit TsaD [bacterium]|nr:tRNA (adenosine(37)-N6)-threonylcarbamoyltransferase complex transferase subunit TsaD [bacterium]